MWRDLAALDDIADGKTLATAADGWRILLCRTGDTVYALENRCSHAKESLEGGRLRAGCIICPHHGARFDLATGQDKGPPAIGPIKRFDVSLEQGRIHVAVPKATETTAPKLGSGPTLF